MKDEGSKRTPPSSFILHPSYFSSHSRSFEANRYVYPVVSRRSRGLSIGVNLNPDKVCNFDCVYCQVDRTEMGEKDFVDGQRLTEELDAMVGLAASGQIYEIPQFAATPPALRRLNDIALSGDGEPTTFRNFEEVATVCADVRRRHGLDDLKLVLITNASMFHRPAVQRGLEILDANGGEIWAKLDAGTEDYYRLIVRSAIRYQQILDNLLLAARARPIVIQTLFLRVRGQPVPPEEIAAYGGRLNEIVAGGGQIKLVQIHTIARPPAVDWVTALTNAEVDAVVEQVRRATGLAVDGYYGT
jgi:wyosine [tRNA(Phe)-imidazoG37] synthetase (radical SAM superfamily)